MKTRAVATAMETTKPQIFDVVRKRYVARTPEEEVRQATIQYLHTQLHYPLELMQVEGSITLAGLTKRCDIVVYNKQIKPSVIVECKKPQVPISQNVVDQACRYNQVLRVPYLYLTNSRQHLFLSVDFTAGSLQQLASLPVWEEL